MEQSVFDECIGIYLEKIKDELCCYENGNCFQCYAGISGIYGEQCGFDYALSGITAVHQKRANNEKIS